MRSAPSSLSERLERGIFFKRWLKNPLALGAILPSSRTLSRFVAKRVMANVAHALAERQTIVEIGAGTGSFTHALLEAGVPSKQLISVELDNELFTYLKKRFPDITSVQGDAQHLDQLIAKHLSTKVAAVVSSIPIVTLSKEVQRNILLASFSLLGPHGTFFQFTYTPFSSISSRKFSLTKKRLGIVMRNIPPATVWSYRQAPGTYGQQETDPASLQTCAHT